MGRASWARWIAAHAAKESRDKIERFQPFKALTVFGRTLLAKSCLLSHIWFPASVSLYDDARLDQLFRATAKFVHHRPLTIIVPARLGLTRDERRLARLPPAHLYCYVATYAWLGALRFETLGNLSHDGETRTSAACMRCERLRSIGNNLAHRFPCVCMLTGPAAYGIPRDSSRWVISRV